MPQIIVKRSAVPGKVPTTTDLALGEIAINTNDGRMFFEKDAGTPSIVEVATLDGTQTISGIKTFDGAVYFSGTVQPTFRATSAAEGGQIVLAYANNTTAMGQGNSTWNIDVAGFSDQLLRFFRVNSSGVADVALTIPDTGAITFNRGITLGTNGFSANGSLGSAGQVLTTNGTSTYWSTVTGGGGGATNLTYSANGSAVTVFSDTGTDAIVLAANSTIAGVLTAEAQTIGGAKTFTASTTTFGTQIKLNGASGALTTGHTGTYGYFLNTTGGTDISGSTINLISGDTLQTWASFGALASNGVALRHNDIVRLQTTGSGATVTGNLAITSTITSGTWNGSVINSTYGGTGVNNGGRTLTINTGNLTVTSQSAGSSITLGGNISTANSVTTSGNFALTLTTTAATNVTLPTTGTLISSADTGTVTSTMIANGTIVDADINASAAIAVSKLAASTISGVTLGNNLNTLTLGTYLTGTSYNGSAAVTAAVDATTDASPSKIVARDSTGAISANTVNVTRADGISPMLNFNTGAGQRAYLMANNSSWSAVVVAGANTSSYPYLQILGDNNGLIYNAGKGGGDQRVWHAGNDGSGSGLDADLLDGLNSASAATASTIVARDASGNFSANTITAALTGNASTATTLATSRTLWGQSFNGSANVTGDLTSVGNITGTAGITIDVPNPSSFGVKTGGGFERLTVASDGSVIVTGGNITPVNVTGSGNWKRSLQVVSDLGAGFYRYSSGSTFTSTVEIAKSKSDTVGTHAALASGDRIGFYTFGASDGTQFRNAAWIYSQMDAAANTTSVPARLVFSTTPSGATTPTDRMVIAANGNVGFGNSSPTNLLSVNGTSYFSGNIDARDAIFLQDNKAVYFGNSSDFYIYHDGTNSYIKEAGVGSLNITIDGPEFNILNGGGDGPASGTMLKTVNATGAVQLYYGNVKRFETTGSGVTVTGNVAITGAISANSTVGSAGQVLTSTGTGIYWATPAAGAAVAAVSDTAPSSPSNGQMWFDSSDGSFNIYYNDGTSAQWINAVNNQNDPVFRVKTSNYTASNRDQIIADTSGGSFTITLPASPIAGTSVTLYDNASWGTNNLTIARNGSTIEGVADDFVLDVSSIKVEFIYNGSTWQVYSSVAQGGPATTPTVSSAEFAAIAIALG